MNWSYLALEALLPLIWALGFTLLGGAAWAVRLHRGGGSSRVAFRKFMKFLAVLLPLSFLATSLWAGRATLRGLVGVVLRKPEDLRAMGLLRLRGDGFLQASPTAAAGWFKRAALQGDAPAQLQLARAFASGWGVEKDAGEALRWAEASARQGIPEAMILAGDLWRPQEPEVAQAWYRQGIQSLEPRLRAREPQACLLYGSLFTLGKGVPTDPVEGFAWMQVAEARGLRGLPTATIRLWEARLSPDQRAEAARRAQEKLNRP